MRRTHRAGFTLVELLVVIGIIALLISILIPTLSRARDRAVTVKCMAQLRNLGEAVFIYAGESRGKIPQHLSTGGAKATWLWDVPKGTRDALVKKGGTRATLYCPGFYEQNVDPLWDGTFGNPVLPIDQARDYSVIGYVWLGLRPDNPHGVGLYGRAYVETMRPPSPVVDPVIDQNVAKALLGYFPHAPAETELAADAIVRNDLGPDFSTGWAVKGGWSDMHVSSHLSKGKPTGANVLFLDGHVAWRPYQGYKGVKVNDNIEPRGQLKSTNPNIYFWF